MSTETSKEKCCEKCKNFKVSIRFGVNRCLNSICPCHSKPPVEEKTTTDVLIEELNALEARENKVATKEERKDFTYSVMPSKVATSEKEWDNDDEVCGNPSCCPPPESEDWEAEFDKKFKEEPKCVHGHTFGHYICEPHDFPHVLGNRFGPDCETCNPPKKPTMENIKAFIRKVYQRGREEGMSSLDNGDSDSKIKEILLRNFDNNKYLWSVADKELKDLIKDTKERALSLAVQEIRKEKKEEPKKCICDRYTHCAWHTLHGGINQGLDKAIEIISGLMKK